MGKLITAMLHIFAINSVPNIYYYYYLFITPQRKHRRTQIYKTRKIMHNKTTLNHKYAAKDAANACFTASFILSPVAVDLTPYLLHRNM